MPKKLLSKDRLADRLNRALIEIHELGGYVPRFCDVCDALTDEDAEVCPNGHSMVDGYDANGSPVHPTCRTCGGSQCVLNMAGEPDDCPDCV